MTDLKRFAGHGVPVTGAAIARRLAEEGGRLPATDRDLPAAERTAAALRERGPAVQAYACDVGDRDSVAGAAAHAVAAFGSLDVLADGAAHCSPDAPLPEDEPDGSWARGLDITLTGVSIGSVNAGQDFGNHAYGAAKAGLGSPTRTLAGHAAARGVRVDLVEPGTLRTWAWEGREAELGAVRALYPLGRAGEPEDIAAAVAFLASRDAACITGATLRVDGGLTAVHTGFRAALGQCP
ncbi:SDR family NAD(P)-dependent oxidoreductase [Streptomyces sp. NPDC051636]|uniref:SDR family NAD(P)-dependent oxidoreductase n=1 Tax=Streptomyces sp. NPDC051636 TaxID=3365663 RepID=UPI00379DD749